MIEAASGQTLDEFIARNITWPLGMDETAFLMSDEQANSVPVPQGWRTGRGRRATSSCDGIPITAAATGCTRLLNQRMLLGDGTSPTA